MANTDQSQAGATGDLDVEALVSAISPARLEPFLLAVGHDPGRALALYLWNAAVGEAFYLPLQAFEVALRNILNNRLSALYGPDWWRSGPVADCYSPERWTDISTLTRRLRARSKPETNAQAVEGLSLGFWVALLESRYNSAIWNSHLTSVFPHLPEKTPRRLVADRARHAQYLRNRISHHEPIFARDLSRDFSRLMQFLGWLSPAKAAWIRPHCRVPALLRRKP